MSEADQAPRATPVYRFAAAIAMSPITVQRWRLIVEGLEHVPRRGGAVIALNHTSYVDAFTAGRPPYLELGRPVRILAKASLFRLPVVGWAMRGAEHIPVERGAGSGALSAAVAALRAGELIGVLPEQTISPSLDLLPFKSGAVRMAQAAGVPVIPAVSWGSHRFWTAGSRPRLSWRLPVVVAYGEPLVPGPDDDPEVLTAELRGRVQVLLDGAQQRYPAGLPAGARWVPARHGGAAPSHEEAERMLEELRRAWGGMREELRRGARRWRSGRGR
jgi:1-acyl-sn-glycerol-3-phosphate acyltransferase